MIMYRRGLHDAMSFGRNVIEEEPEQREQYRAQTQYAMPHPSSSAESLQEVAQISEAARQKAMDDINHARRVSREAREERPQRRSRKSSIRVPETVYRSTDWDDLM